MLFGINNILLVTDKMLVGTDKILLVTHEMLVVANKILLVTDETLFTTNKISLVTDKMLLLSDEFLFEYSALIRPIKSFIYNRALLSRAGPQPSSGPSSHSYIIAPHIPGVSEPRC